jgi:hypothetical protein
VDPRGPDALVVHRRLFVLLPHRLPAVAGILHDDSDTVVVLALIRTDGSGGSGITVLVVSSNGRDSL